MRTLVMAASVILLAACGISAGAQDRKGEAQASRNYGVGAFQSVSLGGSQDVAVRVGPATSVRAEGPADALDRLEIEVARGDLKIGTKRGSYWSMGEARGKVTVYVTTPKLVAASIGGSGNMRIDKVATGRFTAAIGGSGDLNISSMKVDEASFSIAGSGDILAAGSADRQSISVAGSGNVNTASLLGSTSNVSVLGSGNVNAHASKSAKVSVMGSGDVQLAGGAQCAVHKMGSGSVHCGG